MSMMSCVYDRSLRATRKSRRVSRAIRARYEYESKSYSVDDIKKAYDDR